ncbi:MAG: metallophosphoesterase [Phycisphaerae bacterium]|nr:metallophosphoesterase [Phycisphaerae bacterium]
MRLPEHWTLQLVGDSHLGASLPGLSRRANEIRRQDLDAAYRKAVRSGIDSNCRMLLYSGDLWDTPRPPAMDVLSAATEIRAVADAGIPVVVIAGNHDAGVLSGSVWLEHPNLHTVTRPRPILLESDGVRVGIAAIPFIREPASWYAALSQVAADLPPADVRIVLAHQAFVGAVCGAQNFRFRLGRDVVDPARIPPGFDLVATGHVHRPQILQPLLNGPPIVYAGATDRIAFTERNEDKGHARIDFAEGRARVRFERADCRPMQFVPLDITGLPSTKIVELVESSVAALPTDAVAEVRLTGQTTRDAVRGIRIGPRAAAVRDDVLVAVNFRSVQFIANRQARAQGIDCEPVYEHSPFDDPALRAAGVLSGVPGSWVGDLPRAPGTYVLRDGGGRVVYIGKASNLRQRVRSHLRGDSDHGYFGAWAASVKRIDVRVAASELEASIVEAELVRRVRPPFNRQMREWEDYWYLAPLAGPHRQLSVTRAPETHRFAFGPFGRRMSAAMVLDVVNRAFGCAQCPEHDPLQLWQGRRKKRPAKAANEMRLLAVQRDAALCDRYFAGDCLGPCAERTPPTEYEARCDLRDACLRGELDASVLDQLSITRPGDHARASDGDDLSGDSGVGDAVAWVARRARQLRQARALLSSVVHLPGGVDGRLSALVGPRGLRFHWTERERQEALGGEFSVVAVEPRMEEPEERDGPPIAVDAAQWTHVPRELVDPLLVLVRAAERSGAAGSAS